MRMVYNIGRAIFGGFFLYNGINHFQNAEALEGYAAAKQLSYPHLSVKASGAVLIATGAGLVFGVLPKSAALGAAGFLAVASATMHDFWNVEDPQQKQSEVIQFSKNIALLGAALTLATAESKRRCGLASFLCD